MLDHASVLTARDFVSSRVNSLGSIGVVLGSGLGGFADSLVGATSISYSEIPSMPGVGVQGHAGRLVIGDLNGVRVACLQGRAHLYEGHPVDAATFGVRLLAALGCRTVLLTNAAGGLGTNALPGDLMLICDHINFTGRNPLIGPNFPSVSPFKETTDRFPDMSDPYDTHLRELAHKASAETGVALREGVYAGLLGPTYETPAEVRMLRTLGADAVGMSTVLEVIALRHQGVHVGGISLITNRAAGLSKNKLSHQEVELEANKAKGPLSRLMSAWIHLIASEQP